MSSSHRQIRVRGKQRERIDADLVAQLVLMLGRQLAQEAAAAEGAATGSLDDSQRGAGGVGEDWV